jgi:hypothetical protein
MCYKNQNQHAYGDSYRQATNIDEAVKFVAPEIANGKFEVRELHGLFFELALKYPRLGQAHLPVPNLERIATK